MCGEKIFCPFGGGWKNGGSPPRMRGKVTTFFAIVAIVGITPAYAGKSTPLLLPKTFCRDHPRVCGEKLRKEEARETGLGSPPRMRGKVYMRCCACLPPRITPAYAGKSNRDQTILTTFEDHPRVCGEKDGRLDFSMLQKGSPPRVRGKARHLVRGAVKRGITPACAGKRPGTRI